MIAPATPARRKPVPAWHELFLRMAPSVATRATIAFRHLRPEARAEAVQAVLCNVCCALARLAELDKLDLAYPSVLVRFGVAQVRAGRVTGGHLNCNDVLSPYCQRRKGVAVKRLDHFDDEEGVWAEAVIEDTRTSPVPDTVAFRVDFADWLACLSRRDRRVAESLALGNRTQDVARKFDVSEGRVSQLRRELATSWRAFVGESSGAADAAAPA